MLEKYEICCDLFHGFDSTAWTSKSSDKRLSLLASAIDHVSAQEDGKDRLIRAVKEVSQAFALALPLEEALWVRNGISFF